MSEKTKSGHIGTKFLGLFIGIILATVYSVWKFVQIGFNPTTDLPQILLVEVFFLIVFPLIWMLAEILFRYVHNYSEKLPIAEAIPLKFWKLQHLALNRM
jgi:dolichyl-phosphate-mannose--protein O-mannosyl transferase